MSIHWQSFVNHKVMFNFEDGTRLTARIRELPTGEFLPVEMASGKDGYLSLRHVMWFEPEE